MYKIGEVSRYCSIPVKTLRFWADIGLLIPDEVDRFTGYRYYSEAKLMECSRIVALKELGFSLDEIRAYRDGSNEVLCGLIDNKCEFLAGVIAENERRLARLSTLRRDIITGCKNMYNIILKKPDGFCAAVKRGIFKSREDARAELDELRSALEKSMPLGQRLLRGVIINYETEFREEDFDLAIGVEVSDAAGIKADSGLKVCRVDDSCETASIIVPVTELDSAYRELTRQLSELKLQAAGPHYELYHGDYVELRIPVVRLHDAEETVSDEIPDGFENDPDVIGMWEFCDIVPSVEQFNPARLKYQDRDNIWLKRICLMEGGEGYWVLRKWTKGTLYFSCGYPKYCFADRYYIEERSDGKYMFIEMKSNYYEKCGGIPLVYVYRKADALPRTKDDLRIRDELPKNIVPDERVLGNWKACACVHSIESFDPNERDDELFVSEIEFKADMTAVRMLGGKPYMTKYTYGALVDEPRELVEHYQLKNIDGKQYLFIEWKSGDYVYGGRLNAYYVFIR